MLVRTAIVERVNGRLGRGADRPRRRRRPPELADQRGLFLTRLGVDGWFTVHSLVRAALLAELARRPHDALVEQHARAARWLEDAGELAAALDHWLLAGRPRDAVAATRRSPPTALRHGAGGDDRRVIAAIPAHVAGADLTALLEYAWCHVLVDRRRFTAVVEQARWWADHHEVSQVAGEADLAAVDRGRRSTGPGPRVADWPARRWRVRCAVVETHWHFCWNMIGREIALGERWQPEGARRPRCPPGARPRSRTRLALQGTQALGEALAGRPSTRSRSLPVCAACRSRDQHDDPAWRARRRRGGRPPRNGRPPPSLSQELVELAAEPAETMLYRRVLAMLELTQAHLDVGELNTARDGIRTGPGAGRRRAIRSGR